jgi:hypothetical protein
MSLGLENVSGFSAVMQFNEGRPRSAAPTVVARNAEFSYEATNGATFVGIAQEYCTVVLTLSLTPVPTRNRRVYGRSLSARPMHVNQATRNKTAQSLQVDNHPQV